jgi:DNA-directed RNA polymerase specialized sigma24 family protein
VTADNTLLEAVRRGDSAALESLYDRHSPSMYAVAVRILGDRDLAGAALEALFVGLWEGRLTYSPSFGNAAAWLLRVARDQALAMRPPPSAQPQPRATAPTPRQLVEEVFYGGSRVEEIARTYALPETQVKDLLRSGMAELRSQFEAGR